MPAAINAINKREVICVAVAIFFYTVDGRLLKTRRHAIIVVIIITIIVEEEKTTPLVSFLTI